MISGGPLKSIFKKLINLLWNMKSILQDIKFFKNATIHFKGTAINAIQNLIYRWRPLKKKITVASREPPINKTSL